MKNENEKKQSDSIIRKRREQRKIREPGNKK